MKNSLKSIVSIIISLCIMVGLMPLSVFADDGAMNYLFIGDSMSFNFPNGRHHYTTELPKKGHYPAIVAKEMGYKLLNSLTGDDEGLTQGGDRSTDVYSLLSDTFEGDGYTKIEHKSFAGYNKKKAQKLVKKADVISIQLGHSNASVYGLLELAASVGFDDLLDENTTYGHNLKTVFSDEEIARAKPIIQKIIQKKALRNIKTREIQDLLRKSKTRKVLATILGEDTISLLESIQKSGDNLSDTVLYMFMSAMIHFDRVIECIRDINPEAQIYVLGLINPTPSWKLSYGLKKKTACLSAKDLTRPIFDIMNEYYRAYSEYSDEYYYVPPIDENQVEIYEDVLARGDDTAKKTAKELLVAYFNGGSYLNPTKKAEKRAKSLTNVALEISKKRTYNLNDLIKSASSIEHITDVINDPDDAYNYISKRFIDASDSITETDYLIGKVWMYRMMKGVMIHPTKSTHKAIARNVISVMQQPKVDCKAKLVHRYD